MLNEVSPIYYSISTFMAGHCLSSLINQPTCFKSVDGRCIDLILTNKKHSFQKSQSFETGVSDHHHLIYTMLKTTFTHIPPKEVTYRSYRNFSVVAFREELQLKLEATHSGDFTSLYSTLTATLENHAPLKKRVL